MSEQPNPQPPPPEPTPDVSPKTTPQPPAPTPDGPEELSRRLKAAETALEAERRQHLNARTAIDKLKASAMTEAEKAVASAKAEGKAEAMREAGARLAAAEFRARAAGRLADPTAALELLDFTRFVGEDGEPDAERIEDAVARLASATGVPNGKAHVPPAPRVPSGARPDSPEADQDWLRAAIQGR